MKGLMCLTAAAVAVALTAGYGLSRAAAGHGAASVPTNVALSVSKKPTGGKALVFTAKLSPSVPTVGHLYAMQLRGIKVGSGRTFAHPSYVHPDNCVGGSTCSWAVLPSTSGRYRYKVVLSDYNNDDATVGQSNVVRVRWTMPPHPKRIKLFINGKNRPHVSLYDDKYYDFPAGPMQIRATWNTNAKGTGYYLRITDDYGTEVRCSTGTSCRVPTKVQKQVELKVGAEDSWIIELVTVRGNKTVGGFKTCVKGV